MTEQEKKQKEREEINKSWGNSFKGIGLYLAMLLYGAIGIACVRLETEVLGTSGKASIILFLVVVPTLLLLWKSSES